MKVKTRLRAGCDCGDGCTGCSTWKQQLLCDSQCNFWVPPEIEWETLVGHPKPTAS